MIKALFSRLKQGYRTAPFPVTEDALPKRFFGKPRINSGFCEEYLEKCKAVCPTEAINGNGDNIYIDMGKCLFCGQCGKGHENDAISFTRDYRLAQQNRKDLIIGNKLNISRTDEVKKKIKHIFGKSLKLRQVSAGGCNACELDINVLNTLSFDLGRFGIQFVASPRHADGIVVTGPVTNNMRLALEKTYKAVPSPKLVIAVGACAISGGPYINHNEINNGVDSILPVDLYIPGCPPHPLTILDGFLKIMGRIQ